MIPTLAELADLRSEQDAALIHECDTKRPGTPVADTWNHTTYTLATNLTSEPCALVPQQTGGEQVTDQVSAIVAELWLIVALGTDIRETDTVQQVRDENGSTLGGPYRVLRKEIRAMHLALLLEDVR